VVNAVTFTPAGSQSWMRPCAACAQTAVRAPIHVTLNADKLRTATGTLTKPLKLEGTFRVQTDSYTGPIQASGLWEVNAPTRLKSDRNGLQILLTMPSERYVALALNGEAATDEPIESLKAMAVVMRTYALTNASRHAAEGFNLCDSTHCQALGWGKLRPGIEEAVLDTSGETLWFGGRRAKLFYTQHCGGATEDAASVWGGDRLPYLSSHRDPYCLRRSPARWHAEIPMSRIQAIAQEQGWRLPPRIQDVHIVRYTASGRAALLQFSGSGLSREQAEISASSLRFAVDRALGWNQLRSDWYTVTAGNGELRFDGRGYGHGVGLCQTGAYEMASEGRSSRQILNFYFPGAKVHIGLADNGWEKTEGAGWTLMAADPPAETQALRRAGDAAWHRAQEIFPPRLQIRPVVRVMPTTELFRQATSEPGWILGTARDATIFLQPSAVLIKNLGEAATLRHEFLHLLVEREASPATPLWLREGLVEMLSGGVLDNSRQRPFDLAAIDAALAHPQTQTDRSEAERAHAACGILVRRLVERYGMSTVRGWLHSGVPDQAVASVSQPQ
jgi:stage II sporulation protein D